MYCDTSGSRSDTVRKHEEDFLTAFSLAGFQVTTIGRIWVTAEGWWQHCAYDSERNVNSCNIWNRGGLILAEGEFVAYDRGGPAKTDELLISDAESGPDRVSLQNGRILIPKAREAEMRRFVDWLKGKRQTP